MTDFDMTGMRLIDHIVIDRAQTWVGTAYRHQGAQKSVGCDCLGLIRGLWAEIYGYEPQKPEPYHVDWAECDLKEPMYEAALTYFGAPIEISKMHPGCLILFRWHKTSSMKHVGILSQPHAFIHAYDRIGVTQSTLVPSWRRRIAAVFEFPQLPLKK